MKMNRGTTMRALIVAVNTERITPDDDLLRPRF